MNNDWEIKYLDDILELNVDTVTIDPTSSYKFAGVYCFGKGLFEREELIGANSSYKSFNRLHKDHITISKVKGWEGAIALIDENYEGMFLSPQYPTFRVKDKKETEIRYVEKYLMQEKVWKELLGKSVGIGARRNSISEVKFLNLSIPQPPLPEQKRIVAILDSVKNRIDKIKGLRQEQEKEIENFLYSVYCDAEKAYKTVPLNSLMIISDNWEKPISGKIYRQMGIRVWGVGGYERENIDGGQTAYNYFMKVETNDLVINKIWVRNGAMAVVTEELNGCYVSSEFPTFKYDHKILNPKWMNFLIKQKKFWDLCADKSFGTSGKNRIKPEIFLQAEIPLPSIDEQNKLISILDKFSDIKTQNQQNQEELDQLMPSLMDKAFKGEL